MPYHGVEAAAPEGAAVRGWPLAAAVPVAIPIITVGSLLLRLGFAMDMAVTMALEMLELGIGPKG